ncbi:ankyrin repeat domain-containing protein 39 isoform X1 [Numida meleagris]|uniref:ankyrin repeat domain-containing protein 39 isoform X1 n=1 Tax=Numida meleagris TaxID=8996 RepID=UPI000B3DF57B|nr:ankyrin repeat domain-containing protein 39 isoform X1 [Numida meleagris]
MHSAPFGSPRLLPFPFGLTRLLSFPLGSLRRCSPRPHSALLGSLRPSLGSLRPSLGSLRPSLGSLRSHSAPFGSPRSPPAELGSSRPRSALPAPLMAAGRRSPPGPCCPPRVAVPSVHQSLPEMDFERGIWAAARDGDEARVQQLLERRGEPSQPDLAGYTALHYASRNGHLGVCRLLLQHGAHCNARTPGGATALHRASYCGHAAVARLLLAHGADPAAADGDGRTSLHKVRGGSEGTVPLGGGGPYRAVGDAPVARTQAAERGHRELCVLLLQHGPALLAARDAKGRRPRDTADPAVWDLLEG